jgi:hypothetical protein
LWTPAADIVIDGEEIPWSELKRPEETSPAKKERAL